MTGVEGIGNQQEVIDTISKFVDVVQIVGIGLFIVFIGVSVFLIMNYNKAYSLLKKKRSWNYEVCWSNRLVY